jgi:preprotein translocase subunit SecG
MQNIILIAFLVVTVVMIITILMQKSEGGALGIGGGGNGRLMSGKGAKNAISKFTWWMGAAFMGISLLMTVLATIEHEDNFIISPDSADAPAQESILPDLRDSITPPPLTNEGSITPEPESESPIPSLTE